MVILVKNLGNGIKNITINDPKTYNSLSFATLNQTMLTLGPKLEKFESDFCKYSKSKYFINL